MVLVTIAMLVMLAMLAAEVILPAEPIIFTIIPPEYLSPSPQPECIQKFNILPDALS